MSVEKEKNKSKLDFQRKKQIEEKKTYSEKAQKRAICCSGLESIPLMDLCILYLFYFSLHFYIISHQQ